LVGFSEKLPDYVFGRCEVAFAKRVVAPAALCADKVVGRPIIIAEGLPDRIIVVDRHRKADPQVRDRFLHVVDIFLEGEFRGVHANHDKPLVLVFFGPGSDMGIARRKLMHE
jgi:hypothetical protein